jgi:outer membrane protein assembly factor BamB/orotate phosphoribosyltransferase
MKKNNHNYSVLEKVIRENCFVTEEAQVISENSTIRMNWLFDFRSVILKSNVLNVYAEIFWERYQCEKNFQVCGLELASVPLLAAVVMKFHEKGLALNGFIIRKSRKKTGLLKMIEGEVLDIPVIILDDLINTGSSVMRQIEILEDLKKEVKEIFTILRFRDAEYYQSFKQKNIQLVSIFELNDFKDSLKVKNLAPPQEEKQIGNPFTEEVVWYFQGKKPNFFYVVPKSGPVISDGCIYFGCDEGVFHALEVVTGKEIWNYKIPFGTVGKTIFSTPSVYQNLVLFGAYDGNLYALDKETGKRAWVFMEADWIGSSPCIAEDLDMVFIGLEFGLFAKKGGVVSINIKTGEKMWEFRSEELTHASPAYSKKFQVVGCGSNDGVFYLFDAKKGTLKWSFKTGGGIKYAPYFSDAHGFVIVLGFSETVYVLEIKTGKIITKYKMDFGGYSAPIVVNDTVICTSFDKNIHCFDIYTGNLIWKCNTDARCFSTPLLVEEKIYVGSNNGRLFEIEPKTGKVSGIFHTRERIVNKIAYDKETGIFFVPTFANEIIALKKKS